MTQFLGFKNYGDEYKIMGLAAYGKPIYFEKIKINLFKDGPNLFNLNLDYLIIIKKTLNILLMTI